MKSKHDGWSARRKCKRDDDSIARNHGYADYRSMRHAKNVGRLREILRSGNLAEGKSESFVTSEVAEALDTGPKVIRWLAACGHMPASKLPCERARKLWFSVSSIRKYLDSAGREDLSVRSAAIAENPHFRTSKAFTKDEAARELNITRSGVEYYLARGILKKAPSSKKATLITRESLAALVFKRSMKAARAYAEARRRYMSAEAKQKKISGY